MTEQQPIVVTNVEIQKPTYYAKVNSWLKDFTGYDLKSVSSLDNIIKLLHSPRDGSSLAVARIFYGEHQVTNLLFYSIMVNWIGLSRTGHDDRHSGGTCRIRIGRQMGRWQCMPFHVIPICGTTLSAPNGNIVCNYVDWCTGHLPGLQIHSQLCALHCPLLVFDPAGQECVEQSQLSIRTDGYPVHVSIR